MTDWVVILTLLALIQVRIFKVARREFLNLFPKLGIAFVSTILITEFVKRLSREFDFEWWAGIVSMFSSFLISESIFLSKNKNIKLSVYTFSCIYVGFAWLSYGDSLSQHPLSLSSLGVSGLSLIISAAFISVSEKIELSDVAKPFKETPIYLIAASILILIFSYCFR